MARPRAEVRPSQQRYVDAAVRARRALLDARAAASAAEEAYGEAVAAAVQDGEVVPTALARELDITSQAIRDLMKRRG